MSIVQLEVISPMPEGWGLCSLCEMLMVRAHLDRSPYERERDEYPPEWLEDFHRLPKVLMGLTNRYGNRICIQIWDPRSLQGLLKSLCRGVRCYPTFIVQRKNKVTAWNLEQLERQILAANGIAYPS